MAGGLATLLRLRRLEAALARTDLAQAMQAERAAGAGLQAARAAPDAEASILPTDSLAAAAFARWLPQAMRTIGQRHDACLAAAEERQSAGREAGRRKAALEAVLQIDADRNRTAQTLARRRAQAALDDLAGRRRR